MKLLIFIFIFSTQLFSNSIEIISESNVSHGDPVNIVIKLNKETTESEVNAALEKTNKKLGPFYVHNIGFIKNEGGSSTIGLNTFYENPKVISGVKLEFTPIVNLTIENPDKLDRLEIKPEPEFKYYIRKFDLPSDLNTLFIILSIVIVLIVVVLIKRFKDQQRILREEREYYQNWIRAFKACYKREDYERIYKERKKWMPLIGSEAKRFIKVLNKHQYKKEWKQEDMAQVTEEFNKLKDKLISNGI